MAKHGQGKERVNVFLCFNLLHIEGFILSSLLLLFFSAEISHGKTPEGSQMSCKNQVRLPREVQRPRRAWQGFLWLTRKPVWKFGLNFTLNFCLHWKQTQKKTWTKKGEMGKTNLCGSNESLKRVN